MMRLTTSRHPRAWLALLALAGCNQLERVKDSDSGGGGGMPPEVRAAFEGSCGKGSSCHISGGAPPTLVGGALDELVGTRYVTIGDIPNSYIAVKMLPDQTLEALGLKRESGGRMPLDQDFLNPNNQVILAWIAGAEFADSEGDPSTGDPSTGDTETTGAAAPTFTNVQAIFDASCSCHNTAPSPAVNGNLSLRAEDSHVSLVGKKASGLPAMDLVTPMDLSQSYLYLKLTGEFAAAGGTGDRMPPFGAPLSDDQLLLIEEWINAGALDD